MRGGKCPHAQSSVMPLKLSLRGPITLREDFVLKHLSSCGFLWAKKKRKTPTSKMFCVDLQNAKAEHPSPFCPAACILGSFV